MQIRLQRILAAAGIASRRDAERIIAAGRVQVNGQTVTELGSKADPDTDIVTVDGKSIEPNRPRIVILLHKPALVMTTKSDPEGRTTVMDLLPDSLRHLNPVGRLDYETGGLLLMSNDGDLAERLTHPRHHVPKVYNAMVKGEPSLESLRLLADGIRLEEGMTAPARVQRLGAMGDDTWIELVLTQGWNQQVRRMFKAIGHPVRQLKRVALGPLRLGKLAPGEFRVLTQREVEQLRASARPIETDKPATSRQYPKPLATDRPPIPPRRKPQH
ncbi:MAG: rRNA pseudouridine synthase [Candidatus Sericytochromatia bacterium]|nr:rRNA pseudouridine synthase [Candidatus Sericytochromatia bacterium]